MTLRALVLLAATALVGCGEQALRLPPSSGGAGTSGAGAAGTSALPQPLGVAGTTGGAGTAGTPLPSTLTPADVARKLSLFLWEAAPDAALFKQVYDAPPATAEDVRRLAETMLADPRGRAGVRAFFHQWLGLDALGTAKKDGYPEFTPALRAAMIAEAEAFALYVTFDGDGRFPTLLTADFALMNETTAPIYGAAGVTGPELRKVALDPTRRAGVFTLSGVLAGFPDARFPPISARGAFVVGVLGARVPPSPAGLPMPTPPTGSQTSRDWLAMTLGSQAACVVCHNLMDPPGFAFGHYDALGRYQEVEGGKAIDAAGTWRPSSANGTLPELSFDGGPDLARKLAALPETSDAFIRRWLTFASVPDDAVSFPAARDAFARANLDIRALIAAIAATPGFLAR